MINFMDYCTTLAPVIRILKAVVNLIQWGIPIILILFGMIDLGKAVMAGKEDEMKKAQSTLIKRAVYAVAVFLVVFIVQLVMGIVSDAGANSDNESWINCWNNTSATVNGGSDSENE